MSTSEADMLNAAYSIPGHVHFAVIEGGLTAAMIENAHCRGAMTLAGGHLISYHPNTTQQDLLWVSPASAYKVGSPIRGGIPVCWPWFSQHPTQPNEKPVHGFARTALWSMSATEALSDGSTRVTMQLDHSEATHALWPHAFSLQIIATFGAILTVDLVIHNLSDQPLQYSGALHTYFRVSDFEAVSVTGLENTDYLDKLDAFTRKTQTSAMRFQGGADRIYLNTTTTCVIEDPAWQRSISIAKHGSRTTVVWNPGDLAAKFSDVSTGTHRQFICVETANAVDDVVTAAPHSQEHLTAILALQPLGGH